MDSKSIPTSYLDQNVIEFCLFSKEIARSHYSIFLPLKRKQSP